MSKDDWKSEYLHGIPDPVHSLGPGVCAFIGYFFVIGSAFLLKSLSSFHNLKWGGEGDLKSFRNAY